MLNSGTERRTDNDTLCLRITEREEESVATRFHGIDRHKNYSTVSVLDREGRESRFIRSCNLREYIEQLNEEDAVVLEASCESFYWAGRVEERGA